MLRVLSRKFVQVIILVVMVLSIAIPIDSESVQGAPAASESHASAVKIAAGNHHTLALEPDGSVLAWGDNNYRQSTVPTEAHSGVVAVAAGGYHSLALRSDGSVVAWGSHLAGATTVPTGAQSGVVAIEAGSDHSLALRSDGSVVAWGYNVNGETTVPAGAQSGVVAIAAGGSHSLALKSDGSVVAWGSNSSGQTTVPTEAQFGVAAIAAGWTYSLALKTDGSVVAWGSGGTTVPTQAQSGVVAIAAGYSHSLALKSDGSVVAWGSDSSGQTTVPTGAQSGVVAIAAGWDFSLALKSDGSVIGWGRNNNGQTTVPANIASPIKANRIAAGLDHSMALKTDGSVVAWGGNGKGQATVPTGAQSDVAAIAAGIYFSLALKTDGSVVAWGFHDFGQTAVPAQAQSGVVAIAAGGAHSLALKSDGSVVMWGNQSSVPAGAQSGVVAIAAGGSHSLTLKSNGAVVAWGRNDSGQADVPTGAQSGVVAIAAGENHSLALRWDGSVVAWGNDDYGQSAVPTEAQSGVAAIAAGLDHSLALKSDGSVVAWGENGDGQSTVPPGAQSGVAAIAAGGNHSLALKTDGSIVAWGLHANGQTNVPGSSDLIALSIDTGALNPIFNANTVSYATYVRGSVSNVNVTATLTDTSASLSIGGQAKPSGTASAASLTGTSTVIPVRVSPYLLPDRLYSITVIKDTTSPDIAIAMTKADGSAYSDNAWTNQAVTVSIEAADDVSVTSVAYSLDGGASWSPYSSELQLTRDKVYSLWVKAIDLVENETIERRTVKISTSGLRLTPTLTLANGAPYTSGAWTNQSVIASVYAESDASGVAAMSYAIDGGAEQAYVNESPIEFSREGVQSIIFNATDIAGNTLNVPLSVNIDKTTPVIALIGPSRVTLTTGQTYSEQGADATDNVGLAGAVAITGTIHTNVAGTYTLRYNVSDLAGNSAAEAVRTVVVQPPPTSEPARAPASPVIDLNGSMVNPANIDATKPSVTLDVTPNKDGITYASIPASVLTRFEGTNATFFIEIRAPYGSYRIPVHLASLIPGLNGLLAANNLNVEDISFKITLTDKSGSKDIKAAFAGGLPAGKVLGAIVDYHMEIVNAKTGRPIGTADRFSEAITRIIPMPKDLTRMPEPWGAFRYNETTKKFEFVPARTMQIDGARAVTIRSYSNSVYVVAQHEVSFADVQTHWSRSMVQLAAAKGLVDGIGEGRYAPDQSVTRAEFAAMLVRALGRGTSAGGSAAPYADVQPGSWYFGAVAKAKELGLLGFANGERFLPLQPLTREEMASMLAAAIKLEKLPIAAESVSLNGYKDIGDVTSAFLEDVRRMVELEIMTGTSAVTFSPKGETTRAQAAAVLIRTLQALGWVDESSFKS